MEPEAALALALLRRLSSDIREVDVGSEVDYIDAPVNSTEFVRDYVGPNKPCVIRGAIDHWPALHRWTPQYLRDKIGNIPVTVDVTPNGRGDAVTPCNPDTWRAPAATDAAAQPPPRECFCTPHEQRMLFYEFLDFFYASKGQAVPGCSGSEPRPAAANGAAAAPIPPPSQAQCCSNSATASASKGGASTLRPVSTDPPPPAGTLSPARPSFEAVQPEAAGGEVRPRRVPYLQHQNNNLREELPQLIGDIEERLGWAEAVFGSVPDAINLWIGDDRSVTSFHKDPYENLYCQVAGAKVFTLLPPSDIYRMALKTYPAATFTPVAAEAAGSGGAHADNAAGSSAGSRESADAASSSDVPGTSANPSGAGCSRRGTDVAAADAAMGPGASASGAACAGGSGGTDVRFHDAELHPVARQPEAHVSWCPIDPCPETPEAAAHAVAAFPLFFDRQLPPPLRVVLQPGEVLYLPALWYHHVGQVADANGWVVAVNSWFDMKFDARWAHFRMVESLAAAAGLVELPPQPADSDDDDSADADSDGSNSA